MLRGKLIVNLSAIPSHRLKTYFLHQLLIILCFHKDRRAVIAGTGLQGADAELAASIIALMGHFKTSNAIVREEVLQDKHCLGFAIIIAFVGQ